jgi:uncharacterized protein (TIGR02466 family)
MSIGADRRVTLAAMQREAQALYAAGRLAAALTVCGDMIALAPGNPRLLAFAGLVAMRLGRRDEALRHFRAQKAALGRQGADPKTHLQLGLSLAEVGAFEDAIEVLNAGVRIAPGVVALHAGLAEVHEKAGNLDAAEASCRSALGIDPDNADALATLAVVLQRAGRGSEAVAVYRRAIAARPDWGFLYANLCALLLEQGAGHEVVGVADAWLAADPGHVEALSFKAHALRETGDEAGARHLLDFDRFLRTHPVTVPAGYPDLAAFNDALEAHVLAHPTLATPPEDHPTWHHPRLQITEELLTGDMGPVADLQRLMNQAVRDYLNALPPDPAHPFFATRPRRWRLSAWGAVLNGAGNQQAHIHKDGYLSGVYYLRIPEEISSGSEDGLIAGGFEVGRPPDELRFGAEPVTRAVRPYEGLMLLFPAYMYHRTIPFESRQKRICIAFDVVRVD